jgi:CDP-6-deoxy-D-xylo-4-hexulose-3-dehydrase
MEAHIECRPIVTGDFTQIEVMKYFDYEIHKELKNAKYLHEKGLFVGNQQVLIKDEIRYLHKILSSFVF